MTLCTCPLVQASAFIRTCACMYIYVTQKCARHLFIIDEGPLVVERKDQSFIPAVQKLPTKMLCIPMTSCGNTEHVAV